MSFPLFQYLTPPPAPANPNAAAGNLTDAAQGWMTDRRERARLEEQKAEYGQTHELANRVEARYQANQDFSQREDAVTLLKHYNDLIRTGDYAGAANLAPAMKGLGIDLSPVAPDQPDAASAPSPEEWHAQASQVPEAPPVETPPEKQPFKARPIPPSLSRYMASPPAEPAPETPPVDEKAASDERVRAIGGEPTVAAQDKAPQGLQLPVYRVSYKGQDWGVIDPNKTKKQLKEGAERMGEGFTAAVPDEVTARAEDITEPADTPHEQEFAIKNALSLFEQAMRSAAAAKHGKGGGAAPGGFPVGKEAHALQTEIRTTMQAAATDQKVADSNKTLNNISQGLAGLREGGTVGERGAVAQLIKAAFPGAISDQERTYITEANGISGKIANALGYWVETGHMDPALIAQVKKLQEIAAELTKERLRNAATEVAENWGRIHPELSPEAREAYIQEGISLHSPEAARRRRDSLTPKGQERPGFLK